MGFLNGLSGTQRVGLGMGAALIFSVALWAALIDDGSGPLSLFHHRGSGAGPFAIVPADANTHCLLHVRGGLLQADLQKAGAGLLGPESKLDTIWSVNGKDVVTGPRLSPDYFQRGDLVEARLEGPDGLGGRTVKERASILIANAPPILRSVVLQRPSNRPNQVRAVVDVADADGDAVDLEYQWMVDGQEFHDVDANVAHVAQLDRGSSIAVTVVASDQESSSNPYRTPALQLDNQPPSLNLDALPHVARDGDGTLYATLGAQFADHDEDPLTVELVDPPEGFQWDAAQSCIYWSILDGQTVNDVKIRVSDDRGGSAERIVQLKR